MPCLRASAGVFHDAVERLLGGAPEDRKTGGLPAELHGIVTPLAVGDMAAIEIENLREFVAVKGHRFWLGCCGKTEDGGLLRFPRAAVDTCFQIQEAFLPLTCACHSAVR
jgi:hypothetical protein